MNEGPHSDLRFVTVKVRFVGCSRHSARAASATGEHDSAPSFISSANVPHCRLSAITFHTTVAAFIELIAHSSDSQKLAGSSGVRRMIRFVLRRAFLALALILCQPAFGEDSSTNFGNNEPAARDCSDCPPLVVIPKLPGSSNHLMIARHELTWLEYLPSVKEAQCPLPPLPEGSSYPADLSKMADDYPLSWLAVRDFACYLNWISNKTGYHYRLPTGREWEFAARAGADTRFPWGNEPGLNNTAIDTWFDPKVLRRPPRFAFDPRERMGKDDSYFPVESFAPNAWGLYDVVGNLSEVTSDTQSGMPICIRNAGAEKCTFHAVRGGGVDSIMFRLESSGRRIVGEDIEPFKDVEWQMGGFPQSLGYRIVREASEGLPVN